MPILPLLPQPGDTSGGDVPVASTADVKQMLPAFMRLATSAPVRDALLELTATTHETWQSFASYAAQQSSVRTATGIYLQGLGEDRGPRQLANETDDAYRNRVQSKIPLVSPPAIVAAADQVLANYTAKRSRYLESGLDRWFMSDGTAAWHSYVGAVDPDYTDRQYAARQQLAPGGAWVFADSNGRFFLLRVPLLSGVDGARAFMLDGAINEAAVGAMGGMWLGDGTNASGSEVDGSVASFLASDASNAADIYQAIVNAVDNAHGQGMRWLLIADPTL